MFKSYNMKSFGKACQNIRKQRLLTQEDVSSMINISRDTLRRIENGNVIPKFETLELLSCLYKTDLLEVLKENRSNHTLCFFYDYVDKLIFSYEKEKLRSISQDLERFTSRAKKDSLALIFQDELNQFKLFLKAIDLFYSPYKMDNAHIEPILVRSLKITNPEFKIENYKSFKYSVLEIRILLLLSLVYSKLDHHHLSNEILLFLEKQNKSHDYFSVKILISIYTNLAYNYHLLDQHQKVITHALKGIELARSHDTFTHLNLLYFRKGIAEYKLGLKNYQESLNISLHLLKVLNEDKLYQIYQNAITEKYNIKITPTS